MGGDAKSASSNENEGLEEMSPKGAMISEVGGVDSQVQKARWSQVRPDGLVLNTRLLGERAQR